jgi:Zn-dependent metalloprotease
MGKGGHEMPDDRKKEAGRKTVLQEKKSRAAPERVPSGKGEGQKPDLQDVKFSDAFEKLRAGNSRIRIQVDKRRGVVSSISKIQPKSRELEHSFGTMDEKEQISSFLQANQELFGLRDSCEELKWEKWLEDRELVEDMGGDAWLGLRQLHKGIPVHGAAMWAWFSRASGGRLLNQVNNKCVLDINIADVTPKLSAAEALGKALEKYWPGKPEAAKKAARYLDLPLEPEESLEIAEQDGFRLCHVVKAPAVKNGIPRVMTCYVDAMTGELLFAYNGLKCGTGVGYYSSPGEEDALQAVPSVETDGVHQLIDNSRSHGPTITIYALDSPDVSQWEDSAETSPSLQQAQVSISKSGIWNHRDRNRKNDQRPEVDAMRHAGQIVDYFLHTHQWNSFNDAGHDVRIGAHWGENLNGACFDTHKQAIYLGDGDGRKFDFWATKDVIAHEFTHGIAFHTAGFFSPEEQIDKRRNYQYCALDEAFADIFAMFINWPVEEIGRQLIIDNPNGTAAVALVKPGRPWDRKQVLVPPNDGEPEKRGPIVNHFLKAYDYKSRRGFDNATDPHINAGIIEYAAYLITKGGKHPRSRIKVEGIGKETAERLFFRALTKWIGLKNGNATFLECRKALCDAVTKDLHKNDPASAFILESVKNAFAAVGIGPDLYIPCRKGDKGDRSPGEPLPAASSCIEVLQSGARNRQQQGGSAGEYDIFITVRNRGTNPDQTQFTVSAYWEKPDGTSEESILIRIGSVSDSIESRVRPDNSVGSASEKRVGPIQWPADKLPDRNPVRIICVVDGYDDDPEPDMEMIGSVDTVNLYLKSSNSFAWRMFDLLADSSEAK